MPFVPSLTITNSGDGLLEIYTDISDYAGYAGKSAFTNRQLTLILADGTPLTYPNYPSFSFADYPSDTISVSVARDYAVSATLSVDSIELATLTTTAITAISSVAATGGGNITSAGGGTISAKGICWNTTGAPTVSDSHTSDGTGTGAFVSSLTGLSANTLYYVRAYATNEAGTSYGNEQSFTSAATVILTTIAGSPFTANKSTTGNIIYVLEVQVAVGETITGIAGTLFGTNVGADVATSGLKIYRNTTPDLAGSPALAVSGSVTGTTSFVLNYTGLNIFISSAAPRYIVISVDIDSGATTGNTLSFNGLSDPIVLTITGTPAQSNEQSNVSPIITVGGPSLPTVTTTAASSITSSSVTSGGNVTSDGGASVTARGVCWATTINPNILSNPQTTNGTGTGVFVSPVSGLSSGTLYYMRAYATNSAGTAYGDNITFTTS